MLVSGTRLGSYEILSPLGAGGMGEVFRAKDTKLGREVALKVLPSAVASDPDRIARFQREARVLASLNHPRIAAIYGLEEADGIRALVLELVEGETLADQIARGPIPVDEVLPIAKQIAEALEAAHEQGIIHRDLKPANIKITSDGNVKVLDFGLAKLAETSSAQTSVTTGSTLSQSPTITTPAMTMAGVLLGTAAYMSPEQAKGRPADRRSDIWAFGCVLYEMLTGKRAFEGEDVSDTLAFVLTRSPDLSAVSQATPFAIRRLLSRCLERDPRRRLQAIGDARVDIENLLNGVEDGTPLGMRAPAPSPHIGPARWRRSPLLVGAAVGAVLSGLAVAVFFKSSVPPPVVTHFTVAIPEGHLVSGSPRLVDVSPDGTQLVFAANGRLFRKAMWDDEPFPIAGTQNHEGISNPAFSPDGQSIAFTAAAPAGPTIFKIPIRGGTPIPLATTTSTPIDISWTPEGILWGAGRQGIRRVSAEGGPPEQLVTVKAGETAGFPQLLPGVDAVLYTRLRGSDAVPSSLRTGSEAPDATEIVVRWLKSGQDKVIGMGVAARYLPSGHIVYATGGILFAVPFDLKAMEASGQPVAVVEGVRRGVSRDSAAHFAVSASGVLAYIPGPASLTQTRLELALIDRHGRIEPLKLSTGMYEAPRVSPNGTQIAFSSIDSGAVWIYDLAGTTAPRRLTFEGRNRFPIWSANGERVAFQSDREGDLAIFVQRSDGTGKAERLTKPVQGASHVPDAWSPVNDDHLLFSETKGTEVSLRMLSVRERKVMLFGDVRSSLPINAAFSPDGKWIAYQSGRLGDNAVYVEPFPATGAGTKYQISKGNAHHVVWSRDGHEMIYIPSRSLPLVVPIGTKPSFSISRTSLELPAQGTEGGPASIRNYDVMPDGRLLWVVNAGAASASAPDSQQIRVVINWFEELERRVPVN
jgi:serine/threonine-protein kinase